MRNFLLPISIILFFCITAFAQNSKKEAKNKVKQEQYESILNLVQSGKYEFVGRKANPQSGRQIDLTTRPNFLRVKGENASAELPFFGRAFSGGYSNSDGGINFDGPMDNYSVENNDKKRRLTIKFRVKGPGDTYNCILSVSSLESASLSVSSNKKQSISYTGVVRDISEEK